MDDICMSLRNKTEQTWAITVIAVTVMKKRISKDTQRSKENNLHEEGALSSPLVQRIDDMCFVDPAAIVKSESYLICLLVTLAPCRTRMVRQDAYVLAARVNSSKSSLLEALEFNGGRVDGDDDESDEREDDGEH